ncbi:MAG: hypothetical protein ACE5G2_09060, partial [Candidatus Krumholzibacteriia bacterium]
MFSSEPGLVLYQSHGFSLRAEVDTILTYVTATHVRVSHASGDAILDLEADRLVLLDPQTRTYRQMSLRAWEAKIRAAVEESRTTSGAPEPAYPDTLRFESAGRPVEVAGHLCDRYVLYTHRELPAGDAEFVEQQIWVARDLEMPAGAYEAYQRALDDME